MDPHGAKVCGNPPFFVSKFSFLYVIIAAWRVFNGHIPQRLSQRIAFGNPEMFTPSSFR